MSRRSDAGCRYHCCVGLLTDCLSLVQSWTITDASVACQMMGFVVSPDDWKSYVLVPGSADQPIWRSNVRCTNLDMDLLSCDADDEYDHSCTHDSDVYVRCIEPTWAGNWNDVIDVKKREYSASGQHFQPYSVGGSSDATFRSEYCTNLLLLCWSCPL